MKVTDFLGHGRESAILADVLAAKLDYSARTAQPDHASP